MTLSRDICIVGAGPAGISAALKIEQQGIPSLLIDKSSFPREKVCGDAIGIKAIRGLNQIDKEIIETFRKRSDIKLNCWGIRIGFSNGKTLHGTFPASYYQLNIHKDGAAGETAAQGTENNNFSGSFLNTYDDKVFDMLSAEYSSGMKLHRIMKHQIITNTLLKFFPEQKLSDLITAMY